MTIQSISWSGIAIRFLVAIVLVFATYNPEGFSFFHWGIQEIADFSVTKAFVGVVLLIGWTVFIRATLRSLGFWGITLAAAFFGTLLWMVVDWGWVPADSIKVLSYLILIVASGILATGMSWSHIRRRMSGQADVDEIEQG